MTPEAERSQLVHQAIDLMIRSTRQHHRMIEKLFENTGLHRSQRKLLLYLSKHDHTLSQRELADEFDISPACVARALKSLVSEGYILRTGNEDDQRRNDVSITEKGLNVIQDSQRTFEQVDQQAFAGFEAGELHQLIALFTRIQQNLREGEASARSNH